MPLQPQAAYTSACHPRDGGRGHYAVDLYVAVVHVDVPPGARAAGSTDHLAGPVATKKWFFLAFYLRGGLS
jgi:hypothetical protein